MQMSLPPLIEFRLSPPQIRVTVDVRMWRHGARWVVEASMGGRATVAIGATARQALTAALDPAGPASLRYLLADLGLLEPSLHVLAVEAEAG